MRMLISGGAMGMGVFAALVSVAPAQIITQWNFNSLVADGSASTGSATASIGTGTASLIGGVTGSFAAGSPRDSASDNSAWSLASWPAQGTASGMAGAVFMASTAGYTDAIQISFDLRQTATASERFQLQATTNGTDFFNVSGGAATFGTVGNNTDTVFGSDGLFINTAASSSQVFVQSITYTFLAGVGYEDNAQFGFRLVSVFEGTEYDAAGASATYGTTGTVRLDMVTVSSVAAVPEPSGTAFGMGAAALILVLVKGRGRRRSERAPPLAR